MKTIFSNKFLKDKSKAQVFLVCTVIIIIYMLSFITIIYELNLTQYNETDELGDFNSAYTNLKTETDQFITALMANFTQPGTIITTNATAGQLIQSWLDFAEIQMLGKGFVAVFEIDPIIPTVLPVEIVSTNGRIGFRGAIDVYMECNYMSIEIEWQYNINYTLSYVNTATSALIEFSKQTIYSTNYLGYAAVTVDSNPTTAYYNGTYLYGTPLAGGEVIEAISVEQIIVTLVV